MRAPLAIACVLLGGCTLVNDPSAHQQGATLPPEQVCVALAKLTCNARFDCCSTAEYSEQAVAECIADESASCFGSILGPSVSSLITDERTGYDPAIAAEVLAEGEALAARCDVDIVRWRLERSGLLRALRGTVQPGDPCTPDDLTDWPAYLSCEGDRACAPTAGLDTWSCVALRGQGESCLLYTDCEPGLDCRGALPATCQARLANGEACSEARACASLFCDDTGRCAAPTEEGVYCAM